MPHLCHRDYFDDANDVRSQHGKSRQVPFSQTFQAWPSGCWQRVSGGFSLGHMLSAVSGKGHPTLHYRVTVAGEKDVTCNERRLRPLTCPHPFSSSGLPISDPPLTEKISSFQKILVKVVRDSGAFAQAADYIRPFVNKTAAEVRASLGVTAQMPERHEISGPENIPCFGKRGGEGGK